VNEVEHVVNCRLTNKIEDDGVYAALFESAITLVSWFLVSARLKHLPCGVDDLCDENSEHKTGGSNA